MAKLAYATDLKSVGVTPMSVRFRLPAPNLLCKFDIEEALNSLTKRRAIADEIPFFEAKFDPEQTIKSDE